MANHFEKCHDCGCEGDAAEFRKKRIRRSKRSGKGKVFEYVFLCPICDARHGEGITQVRGRRCDQCGARISSGEAQVRSKTETELLGAVARHQTVQVVLCPACADEYDSTGSHLVKVLVWLTVAVLFVICAGLLFGSR